MGFKLPKQGYKLTFEAYDGFWMRVTSPTVREVTELTRLILLKQVKPDDIGEHELAEIERPQRILAKHLKAWNLTEEVEKEDESTVEVEVPPTLDGVLSLPSDFFGVIIQEWIKYTTGVPDDSPLRSRSLNGLRFPEESIPMEALSLNLPS